MFKDTKAFSSFSVPDLGAAKQFYGETLGIDVVESPEGLELHIAGGTPVFIYPSDTLHGAQAHRPQLPRRRYRGGGRRAEPARRHDGAVRPAGDQDGREGDLQGRRRDGPAGDCVVQGPRRSRPLSSRDPVVAASSALRRPRPRGPPSGRGRPARGRRCAAGLRRHAERVAFALDDERRDRDRVQLREAALRGLARLSLWRPEREGETEDGRRAERGRQCDTPPARRASVRRRRAGGRPARSRAGARRRPSRRRRAALADAGERRPATR